MRRVVLLMLAAVALSCAEYEVDFAGEVHARSSACAAAVAAKDIKGATAFWAEDAILQAPGSPQFQGREAVRGVYGEYFPGLWKFSADTKHIAVSRSEDLAFEYGVYRIGMPNSLYTGNYLVVWKKTKDNWYIAALSFTDPPLPKSSEVRAEGRDLPLPFPLPPDVRVFPERRR